MNRSFKTLWSKTRGCMVVTSEHQKSQKVAAASILLGTALVVSSFIPTISFASTTSTGDFAYDSTKGGIAGGNGAQAIGDNSVAFGATSKASGGLSIALGGWSSSSGDNSVAIGYASSASVADGIALGRGSAATTAAGATGYLAGSKTTKEWVSGLGAVSIGNATQTRQITGLAAGTNDTDAVNVAQLKVVNARIDGLGSSGFDAAAAKTALEYKPAAGQTAAVDGFLNKANAQSVLSYTADNAKGFMTKSDVQTLIGSVAPSGGSGSTSTGNYVYDSTKGGIAGGNGAQATGENSVAFGATSKASGGLSIALGGWSSSSGDNSVAIGYASSASVADGIALGRGSAATTAAGATGYLAGSKTTKEWVSGLGAVSIGNATQTRQITGLAAGTNDTDAVNVAQLKVVNARIDGLGSSGFDAAAAKTALEYKPAAGQTAAVDGFLNKASAQSVLSYAADNAKGFMTKGDVQTLINSASLSGGQGAVDLSIYLTKELAQQSYASKPLFENVSDRVATLESEVTQLKNSSGSVGGDSSGSGANAAAGGNYGYDSANNIHDYKTAAIKTEGAVHAAEFKVASGSGSAQTASITFDENEGRLMITRAAPNTRAGETTVGLATVDDGITFGDGTNTSKLNVQNGKLDIVGDNKSIKTELVTNEDGSSQLKISYIGEAAAAAGGSAASANGLNIAASGDYQAVTIEQGNVSLGGNRIQNIGDAQEATDAVNLGQLGKVAQGLSNEIRRVDREARAGVAQAIATAGLPQVYMPGRSMLVASAATYRGQGGFALGFSHATEDRGWVFKGSASADTRGGFGGSVGAGFQF